MCESVPAPRDCEIESRLDERRSRDHKIVAAVRPAGVPLYVLYPAKNEEPIVFPEVLTKGMILDKLETVARRVASQ
jgi:Thiol:disulfide interchange protein